jgi:pimeloyl-ACP methyl ester carboxylesterase
MTTKVFVHGNPEVDAIWALLVDELRARGVDDVVLLSPPGFGAPTPAGWAGDVAAYRTWLIGELERIGDSGQAIDLVGHDWGAGHVFGAVAERPDLVRSFAADCAGLIHPDYVWHDMAQVWQTPGAGEDMVASMVDAPVPDRQAMFQSLGAPGDIAQAMAEGATDDMARCILTLYRDAAQPAAIELGERLAAATRPPALFIVPSDDPYVSAELAVEMATRLGAEQLPLPGCGHWWMFEEPGRAADGLVAFWSRVEND